MKARFSNDRFGFIHNLADRAVVYHLIVDAALPAACGGRTEFHFY